MEDGMGHSTAEGRGPVRARPRGTRLAKCRMRRRRMRRRTVPVVLRERWRGTQKSATREERGQNGKSVWFAHGSYLNDDHTPTEPASWLGGCI